MSQITYHDGYKYQLIQDYTIDLTPYAPSWKTFHVVGDYIMMKEGVLTIMRGYAWDGPSGPTVDTLNFMRGSLIHDALYQLIREKFIPKDGFRQLADDLLYRVCLEDGMTKVRALWVYYGVRVGGNVAAVRSKPQYFAPKKESV